MASFTNDPNHYAHPLFQHMSVPTKKKAIKSKNLPSWMVHTVKRGYTSYLVHTNPNTLTAFEPAGVCEKYAGTDHKESNIKYDWIQEKNNIKKHVESYNKQTEDKIIITDILNYIISKKEDYFQDNTIIKINQKKYFVYFHLKTGGLASVLGWINDTEDDTLNVYKISTGTPDDKKTYTLENVQNKDEKKIKLFLSKIEISNIDALVI